MTARLLTIRPGSSPAPPGGPAGRYLTNPGGYTGHLARLLLSARRGEGLLAAGPSARVSFQALASPAEHFLCTSDPAEIARMQASQPSGAPAGWLGSDSGPEDSDPEDMLP